jgi:hypothetical protein
MGQNILPSVTVSELKKLLVKLKSEDFKELKSFEVTANSEYLFTVIIPRTDFIKQESLYKGELSNSVGGTDPRTYLEE